MIEPDHLAARGEYDDAFLVYHNRPRPHNRAWPALYMEVRDETAETPRETGAWSPKRPRRTWNSTSRPRGVSPPAWPRESRGQACRSGVYAVAV